MSDWGFYADKPGGALDGAVANWCFWWTDGIQAQFQEAWGEEADALADELADRYAFVWPWMIENVLPTHAPLTQARIEEIVTCPSLVRSAHGTNPKTVLSVSTVWGAFHTVRRRRQWSPPSWQHCGACGQRFFGGEPPVWTYHQFGPSRYCTTCCFLVRDGRKSSWTREGAISAFRELAAAAETIPPQSYPFQPIPLSVPVERRDRLVRALCAMPPLDTVKSVLGADDWLGVLQAAGLVASGWRPSRGTWCRAADGHRCRSLLEKSIDDWFSANGLAHNCEPLWPAHPELNPSGRLRADWSLPSGTYVECAGMLADPSYRKKIERKQELARALGIHLQIVAPSDLLDLASVFAAEIDGRR